MLLAHPSRGGALAFSCAFILFGLIACSSAKASQIQPNMIILEAEAYTPTPRPTSLPYPTATPGKTADEITRGLSTSRFLDSTHSRQGVECTACHTGGSMQQAPAKEVCLGCHGGSYMALADKTSKLTTNPHRSHIGQIPCTYCHNVHAPFDYYCTHCHSKFTSDRFN